MTNRVAMLQRDSEETINLLHNDIELERAHTEELRKLLADQKSQYEKDLNQMKSKIW